LLLANGGGEVRSAPIARYIPRSPQIHRSAQVHLCAAYSPRRVAAGRKDDGFALTTKSIRCPVLSGSCVHGVGVGGRVGALAHGLVTRSHWPTCSPARLRRSGNMERERESGCPALNDRLFSLPCQQSVGGKKEEKKMIPDRPVIVNMRRRCVVVRCGLFRC